MSTSLQDAETNKFIPTNVALGVKIPKTDEEIEKEATTEKTDTYHPLVIDERKTFTIEQVVTIIKESINTPIYLHVLFATLMGYVVLLMGNHVQEVLFLDILKI